MNENVSILTKIPSRFVPKGSINIFHIGSDNGAAPIRRQAIVWTNDGLFNNAYVRHSASMS